MPDILESVMPYAVLGIGAYLGFKWLTGSAFDLGKDFGAWAKPALDEVGAITAWGRSHIQYQNEPAGFVWGVPSVPVTPSGYNPSNWTWQGPNNTMIGLPAGMTFKEFCNVSPGSPMCAPGYWGL